MINFGILRWFCRINIRSLYRSSQDLLTRTAMDARSSVIGVVDFYDKVSEKFNNETHVSEAIELTNLHPNFVISQK